MINRQGKDHKTRGTDAPSLLHKKKKDSISPEITSSCETSNAQTHTEIGSLPKAGHCQYGSRFLFTKRKTRTGRIYQWINGNLGILFSGRRQLLQNQAFSVIIKDEMTK